MPPTAETPISPAHYALDARLNIKSWAEEDRPREKMASKGRSVMSEAELIAIIIGSGNRNESAVDLSKRLLHAYSNDLQALGRASLLDLQKFKGIGEAKAISIAAALELGRRRQLSEARQLTRVRTSHDAYTYIAAQLADLGHEEFWILMLNRSNHIVNHERISTGGVAGTVVDPRFIFKSAIQQLASGIILVHNHPSGNLNPSQSDKEITKRLKLSGDMLEIPILDHLIITDNGFFSFADDGLL